MSAEARPGGRWSRLVTGLTILSVGVIFWLDQIGRIDARQYAEWWPLVLVVIGLSDLLERRWVAAVLWMAAGAYFLMPAFGYERPSLWLIASLFPLMFSIAGVALMVQALRAPAAAPGQPAFNAVAVMAGNVRRITAPAGGGQAVAVMGNCQIDIAAGALKENEFVLDVLAFWGGIEVIVPRGWNVVPRVAPILAGVDDKTVRGAETAPRVIIRGTIIMSGVEIRNAPEPQ